MTTLDLAGLNDRQRDAVEHGDGPLLVFAGAGSGKTRVLTYRLAHLIDRGAARPWQILAVTFTNKAAGEMKRRVQALVGPDAGEAWVQTFHSACLRLLRREAAQLDMDPRFVIYDERDQRDVIRRVLREVDPSRKLSLGAVRARIEEAKRRGLDPDDDDLDLPRAQRAAYALYQQRLRESNAVDFSDLIGLAVKLLEQHDEVRERYQHRFRHLLVDEFQDTDGLQYRLVQLLAGPDDNLCVVGDDDQSIYSFRGADVGNIRGFTRDYPSAKVVKLDQNYRSTTAVLDAASRVVDAGGGRSEPKQLWTARGDGEAPTLEIAFDEADEAERVIARVRRSIDDGFSADAVAVLFRTNAQSRALEDGFRRAGLPYVLVGGMRFYERREIKDTLAYVKVLVQPRDRISFERAIQNPSRGIGAKTIGVVEAVARERGISFEDAIAAVAAERKVGPALVRRLEGFRELLTGIRDAAADQTAAEIVASVIERSGIAPGYREEDSHEARGRLENLEELQRSVAERSLGRGMEALQQWLDQSALASDLDHLDAATGTDLEPAEDEPRISLLTIHAAKGLEFPVVCLVGLDEGIFPNSRAAGDQPGLEEEFRLCYVACTRAEDRLHLFRSRERTLIVQTDRGSFPRKQRTRPSPFVPFLLDQAAAPSALRFVPDEAVGVGGGPRPGVEAGTAPRPSASGAGTEVLYEPEDASSFHVGMRVRHPSFGDGVIRGIDGHGGDIKLSVIFRGAGMKRLIARFARLQIVGD